MHSLYGKAAIFFAANDIPAAKNVPFLLTCIGGTTYGILRNLVAPGNPMDMSYEDLTHTLRVHFDPKPLVIVERFHFHKRDQSASESVAEYLAELRRLAAKCEFGTYLEEALRDRLVCGIRSDATRKKLLGEADLDLTKASQIATAMESAHTSAQSLKAPAPLVASVEPGVDMSHTWAPGARSPPCNHCGISGHTAADCRFKDAVCHRCYKRGYLGGVCRSHRNPRGCGRSQRRQMHHVEAEPVVDLISTVYCLQIPKTTSEVNSKPLTMEVDTGAVVSLISHSTQKKQFPTAVLTKPRLKLRTYTFQPLALAGQMSVRVKYGEYDGNLTLYVVEGSGPSLLGRNWLGKIRLDWSSIQAVQITEPHPKLARVLERHSAVFKETPGRMTKHTASLLLQPGTRPIFRRPHAMPFAMKAKVGKELDKLEEQGIIQKVYHASWAAPIVVVHKKDGRIRICGNYKLTINPYLDVDQYPLPRPEDLMTCLTGGKQFSKLDLRSAYQQMPLEEESANMVTINTHQGLYRYTKLPFGVSSAPAIFQRTMDSILQGLPRVICYLDEILITGVSEGEHLENLEEVLRRLEEHGLTLHRAKCAFLKDSVEYLGQVVDAHGVHTSPRKVQAVKDAPPPKNVHELRSTLGMINYYRKFIPNLSALLEPLYRLLREGVLYQWTNGCELAFGKVKACLIKAPVLAHYDPDQPLVLAADASAYGLGAVLSHTQIDGPVTFASRTLTTSEQNYSQIEKEALSLVFGVCKFHQYIYGRRFTLMTDHQPLLAIFGPKRGMPTLAAARMQRWALILSTYTYDIVYRSTKQHANADGLSRLPLPITEGSADAGATQAIIEQIEALPVNAGEVAKASRQDPELSQVIRYERQGWPAVVPTALKPFRQRQGELTTEGSCLLWGGRVVIPQVLRPRVMEELHCGHPGVVRMKQMARSHAWWPGMDHDIETAVRACEACQSGSKAPPTAPLHSWTWPEKPWERIHIDYLGPVEGKMMLVAVDSHSKWPEVIIVNSTTSAKTVAVLREMFARNGLPLQLVSDNGPQFCSEEFQQFMATNGIKHTRTAPYHPASNGQAERLVQSVKQSLRAAHRVGVPLEQALASFLLRYRVTPHATTGVAPCTLFMNRTLRTRLDLLSPAPRQKVLQQQAKQKEHHDAHARCREFQPGQPVWARDVRGGAKWVKAVVQDRLGPVSYVVRLDSGVLWRRHVDHLKHGLIPQRVAGRTKEQWTEQLEDDAYEWAVDGDPANSASPTSSRVAERRATPAPALEAQTSEPEDVVPDVAVRQPDVAPTDSSEAGSPSATGEPVAQPRYPSRTRKPPDRLYAIVDEGTLSQ